MTGHDQQGVIDPDPETYEHAEDGGEAGHGEGVAEQSRDRVSGTDGDESGDEREERGKERPEREAEHDECEHHAEQGALRPRLGLGLLDVLTPKGHLQLLVLCPLRRRDDPFHRLLGQALGLLIEGDGGERHGAVPAHLGRTDGRERTGHRSHVRQACHFLQHVLCSGRHRRVPQAARLGVEDDLVRTARDGGELLLEQVQGRKRLGVRQLELGGEGVAGGPVDREETHQGHQPQREDDPAMAKAPPSQRLHEPALWSRAARAASSRTSSALARFSSRCAGEDVPGISSTVGAWVNSQASATWAVVAPRRLAV